MIHASPRAHPWQQGLLKRIAVIMDTAIRSRIIYFKDVAPFRQGASRSTVSKSAGVPLVPCLHDGSCLNAVLRVVTQRVVAPLDRVLRRWHWAHVSKKIWKPIPSFTYSDATPAISLVARLVWVLAATMHCLPSAILDSAAEAVSPSAAAFCKMSAMGATATYRVPAKQAGANWDGLGAAVAHADPSSLASRRVLRMASLNGEQAKPLSADVAKGHTSRVPVSVSVLAYVTVAA